MGPTVRPDPTQEPEGTMRQWTRGLGRCTSRELQGCFPAKRVAHNQGDRKLHMCLPHCQQQRDSRKAQNVKHGRCTASQSHARAQGITEPGAEIHPRTYHNIVQDQVVVMITATKQLIPPRNPTHAELEHVARRLVQKYPGLKTQGEDVKDAHTEEPQCNDTYIGETSQPLKERYKRHCRTTASGYSSAIYHHTQHNQGHSFRLETTDILHHEPRWYERGVKEAIYERIYNPTLNRKGGLRVELSKTAYTLEHHGALLKKELEKKSPSTRQWHSCWIWSSLRGASLLPASATTRRGQRK
ncbi:hypothetical protein Bbelb_109090 [Branchiostoma belcheri]|nr:hypothetical protein Bbelb_109090 [Branchiostoma belcheri]